ncbi:hypothetical protein JYK14_08080 [Siccirubricoccus sp. KC 17139]|uniref:Uncharacterized protein n=1 Tax=Siccirubricoccus soli TaxID=2899147 RepID=A0ABT1D2H4_9PROT|nr:hypothetical protein [Siccirubricoccus soli]MCO6416123.1 hypothetical protein [Siccirubricoccus soli]MCP2682257.1 hypothetical protein [Siccirubricoccus soli]
MSIRTTLAGVAVLAGMATAAAPATAADAADRGTVLAQAAGQREGQPRGPHFDPTQGGGQQPHTPGRGAPTPSR